VYVFVALVIHHRTRVRLARYDKKMYVGHQVKYSLFLSDFNESRNFSTDF